jgi:hypothetical protein
LIAKPKRVLPAVACILLLALLHACGGSGSASKDNDPIAPPPVTVTQVTVTSPLTDLEVGQLAQLGVTVRQSDGTTATNPVVSWSSSSNAIATISATGVAQGVAVGNVTITAQSGGKQGQVGITVTNYAGTYNLATVNGAALPLNIGVESCVQPPLTVCSIREYVTGGSLLLKTDRKATFTELHRTDITTSSGTTSGVSSETWTGSYNVAGTTITLPMTLGVNQRTFVGVLTGLRVTMPVIQSGVTFSYSFQR